VAWEWDPSLYAGAAAYYPTGRMPYPPPIAETLRRALELDGRGRLLDVGCGPGSLTLLFAPLFEEALGVDADADMIAAAAAEASLAGVGNVRWQQLRAEHLPAGLGTFRVVSFAQSFHWFDRPLVARSVRQMLEPGGAVVLVSATTHHGVAGDDPLPHPRPPLDEIGALIRRWLGPVRRAGRGRLPEGTPGGEEEVFRAVGFSGPDRVEVAGAQVLTRTEDHVVAAVFSLSFAAPHLFGVRVGEFEAELRALLGERSPERVFSERAGPVGLDLYRLEVVGGGPEPS